MSRIGIIVAASWIAVGAFAGLVSAQNRPAPAPVLSPKQAALIDLTGYWVAIVDEDWRWKMVTPSKGDYASIPLNADGRKAADAWDLDKDNADEINAAPTVRPRSCGYRLDCTLPGLTTKRSKSIRMQGCRRAFYILTVRNGTAATPPGREIR